MTRQRMIGGALGAVLAMLLLAGASVPAHAAPAGTQSILAESPAIRPDAERFRNAGFPGSFDCPSGRACLSVWDDWLKGYKVVDLYRCGTYTLSYWEGLGRLTNNQTGGAVVTTYGQHGQPLGSYRHNGSLSYYDVYWNEVWKVKPC
jgi:hypothetical protein